ncbi:MAG: hypothetical protein EOP07_01430 [Proteobacteria bacterium]|nr:MAG: hypothetical protein EOP07_01430 [Pseudomonadota bacterium]
MKQHISALCLSPLLVLAVSCGKSSSSNDETPVAENSSNVTAPAAPVVDTAAPSTPVTPATPAAGSVPSESQAALTLGTTFLEFSRLQYDCGDVRAPIADSTVLPFLVGVGDFETLAATVPAKDVALVKTKMVSGGESCSYRALFSVNRAFTEVTYTQSQALKADSFTACSDQKAIADAGFGSKILAFDYDKQFIRWVALHIPPELQSKSICPTGSLRAVFAAQ